MTLPMLVLAIACVNAANLVLARSSRRVRDWTVRLALGATRWRVARQVLAESMMLSAAAAGLGLLLARWALSFIASQIPFPMPLDQRIAVFTIAIAVLTAVTCSLGPALGVTSRATRRADAGVLRTSRSVRSPARFALVALQAALSLGLLATGAQFTKTVQASATQEYIPDADRLVLARSTWIQLRLEREAGEDFYRRLRDRVTVIPGVAAAGFSTRVSSSEPARATPSPGSGLRILPPRACPDRLSGHAGLVDAVGVPTFRAAGFPLTDAALRDTSSSTSHSSPSS